MRNEHLYESHKSEKNKIVRSRKTKSLFPFLVLCAHLSGEIDDKINACFSEWRKLLFLWH